MSAFGSKYFGWLAALIIVLAGGWYFLPSGYEALILWLSPQLGNYVRPTMVMINLLLVNPLNNITMFAIWGVAGLVGGMIAGTKKGAFVVGLVTWLCCIAILAFSLYQLFTTGLALGTLPPIPEGSSIIDILSIPLVQSAMNDILPLVMGMSGGGGIDPMSILMPIVYYFLVPVVTIIIAGIIGATIRAKD